MPISIGLPFFNAELYLEDAIASVFAQTYTDWELILMDDGSTDNSLEIAKSIKDPRIRVYSDGKNKKLATRLNEIVKLSKYDILARMDADDLMSPNRLKIQMDILEENQHIDLVSTGLISIKDNLEFIGARGSDNSNISLEDLLYKRVSVVHAAMLGRISWFLRNPYDPSLKIAQDYDLWLRSSSKNDFKIITIKTPLYYYREEKNVTFKKIVAAYKNERKMYRNYGGKHMPFLVLKSYLKSNIVFMLNLINKLDLLLSKRSSETNEGGVLKSYSNDLEIIRKMKTQLIKK